MCDLLKKSAKLEKENAEMRNLLHNLIGTMEYPSPNDTINLAWFVGHAVLAKKTL